MLLLTTKKANQQHFDQFLFHFFEVVVCIEFTLEKNYFLTSFARCKLLLWKTGGL